MTRACHLIAVPPADDLVKAMVYDIVNEKLAEDIVAGRITYNFDTGFLVTSALATDEERAAAVASVKRLLAKADPS